DNWVLLDRQRGLTLKVPDGRGKLVAGLTFNQFEQRHAFREQFESMRLLYVAATRAQDRLILSGTTRDIAKVGLRNDTWLNWIWRSLELPAQSQSGVVELTRDVQLQLTINLADEQLAQTERPREVAPLEQTTESADSISAAFPLLRTVEPERDRPVHRFSVTQLINYQRCPRQYYFDRVLHAPAPEALAVWNDAEAPEPPANLTATLKGAVIHRFCETYTTRDNAPELLRKSFAEIVRLRQAELAERISEIDPDEAIAELLPLAQNYLSSAVFERIERARTAAVSVPAAIPLAAGGKYPGPRGQAGLWSELSFRLRRPLGILSGAIDKLLITPAANGQGFDIEIIDFKTNRLRHSSTSSLGPQAPSPASSDGLTQGENDFEQLEAGGLQRGGRGRPRSQQEVEQFAFDFNAPVEKERTMIPELSLDEPVAIAARDYQLQMQAYALAMSELAPSLLADGSRIVSTLHFLEPNIEFHLGEDLVAPEACRGAIDGAIRKIIWSGEPHEFPVRTAAHCRRCNFLSICRAGREFVRELKRDRSEHSVVT
ncbi:MAG TPA: PD-(D/E)XK nuclease family protein, partial [Pyrinomonadaceae bacterium]|nr:PD-(D/E)XK nuclease family protein [Pyrinomonadaceae bacterium]